MNVPTARLRPYRLAVSFVVALTILTGCSFLKPATGEEHDYLLSPVQGLEPSAAQTQSRAYAVRILPVELPDYLLTSDIAIRTGTNEIFFAKFHQWAEPLGPGIRRVLVENLQAAGRDVLTDQPSPADVKVYTVSVRVLACEANDINGQGSVHFEAAWEIASTGSPLARGIFKAPPSAWHPGDYGALAAQLSHALADFSKVLDQAISTQTNGRAS